MYGMYFIIKKSKKQVFIKNILHFRGSLMRYRGSGRGALVLSAGVRTFQGVSGGRMNVSAGYPVGTRTF